MYFQFRGAASSGGHEAYQSAACCGISTQDVTVTEMDEVAMLVPWSEQAAGRLVLVHC
jgi:hypothetical protein